MGRQVVHDDGIALRQGRDEHLLDVDQERFTIHRAIEQKRRAETGAAQARSEGGCLPVSPRNRRHEALSSQTSATLAHHLGIGAGLVDEDQRVGIETRLATPPDLTALRDVRPVLFARVQAFF